VFERAHDLAQHFSPEATPAEVGLRHGETLHLRPRGGELPGVSVHDRADTRAAGQDDGADRWDVRWSRIRGQAAFVPSAGGLAALLWWSGVAWGVRAVLAGFVCAVALAGAGYLSRAWPDATTAVLLAMTALPFALLTAVPCALRGAGPRPLSPAEWAYALLAVALTAAVAALTEASARPVWLGCAVAAVVGAATACATAVWTSVPAAGPAAVAPAVVLPLSTVPSAFGRLAQARPAEAAEATRGGEGPSAGRRGGGEPEAASVMTVCTVVLTLVGVAAGTVLAVSGGWWGRLACALAAVQLLLGSRRFSGGAQRAALVSTGALALALAAAADAGGASSALSFTLPVALLIVPALLALRHALVAPPAEPAYPARLRTSRSGTGAEFTAWLALAAVAGVLCGLCP
jgi:hypothetical protein